MSKRCAMLTFVFFAIVLQVVPLWAEQVPDGLVCHYVGLYPGTQIILGFDGFIRFLEPDAKDFKLRDATLKADIFHETSSSVRYKIVMEGRTDSFYVNRKSLRGTQKLKYPDAAAKTFGLRCEK
jgi:hypothetical protein